jgi:23S rRNA pseudouridine1911/1915/1917 synthase
VTDFEQGEPEEPELYEHTRIEVDKGQQALRIDKFLSDKLPKVSRNRLQIAARAGCIKVNGAAIKASYKVKPLDQIALFLPHKYEELEITPEFIPLDIVYEDESLVIINKPAGLVVHPGFGNYKGTLVNALAWHFEHLPVKTGEERPGLVHRLDKLTSGIMVVAKTEYAMTHLARQFFERTSERRYHALVWGDLAEEEGSIRGAIGRSTRDRKLRTVVEDELQGKPSVTHYKVLRRFGYVTLVECKLETGRTHQIRVHFKHIGHPLFGDPEYGGNKILKGTVFGKYKQFVENCFALLPRQALHAKTLGFAHPETETFVHFDSEIPQDMQQVIDKWARYTGQRITVVE